MPPLRDYRELVAWQEARELVKRVYALSRCFPREDLYGLTQQFRRAAISVPSNIAEGYGRGTRKDYVRFLQMARGSLYELHTQLLLAEDLGHATQEELKPAMQQVETCSRLLHALIRSLIARKGNLNGRG